MRRTWVWLSAAGCVVVLAAGLAWFEPWRLLTASRVDEPTPVSAVEPVGAPTSSAAPLDTSSAQASPSASATPAPKDEVVARGEFESAEHTTSGDVRVLRLADGRRFVRLEGLETSDGPDLHVWLTDQPSGGAWSSYDDGRFVRLGELKATGGDQNYAVPADADLSGLTSVVIWCDRFDVAFGTAAIEPVTGS